MFVLDSKAQNLVPIICWAGVDKIEIDAAKGTLTVTGDADPVEIITRTRRTGKTAEVVSVGPPPPPPKPDAAGAQKKAEDKKPEEKKTEKKAQQEVHVPQACHVCEQMGFHIRPYDTHVSCTIMWHMGPAFNLIDGHNMASWILTLILTPIGLYINLLLDIQAANFDQLESVPWWVDKFKLGPEHPCRMG